MTKIQNKKHLDPTKPRTICADGLKISLRGHIPTQKLKFRTIKTNLTLNYRKYGTPNFESSIKIFYHGEEIGTMDAHPKSSILPPDLVILSIQNRMFYQEGWTKKLKKVLKLLQLDFAHINQIDIATDTPDQDGKSFDFIYKLVSGSLRQIGNTNFKPTFSGHNEDGKARIRNLDFGSRSSNKFMRCYYKKQELQISNKWYIKEFWKRNGFELQENQEVARFEMVIKRAEFKRYKDVFEKYGELTLSNIHLLESTEYLATLFNTAQKKFFEFVSRYEYNKHQGDASRCKKKRPVDLRKITTYLLEKITSKATTMIWSAKITAKTLYMLYCQTGEDLIWRQINDILQNYGLARWFENGVDRFYKEYEVKYKSVGFEYLKSYTITPEFIQTKIFDLTAGKVI